MIVSNDTPTLSYNLSLCSSAGNESVQESQCTRPCLLVVTYSMDYSSMIYMVVCLEGRITRFAQKSFCERICSSGGNESEEESVSRLLRCNTFGEMLETLRMWLGSVRLSTTAC